MASKRHWIIFVTDTRLRVVAISRVGIESLDVPIADDRPIDNDELIAEGRPVTQDTGPLAVRLEKTLAAAGYRGEGVVLALDSPLCLAATFAVAGRSMARDRAMMTYALEEELPWAAEEMVADFVTYRQRALGVAVELSAIGPLTEALQEAGMRIDAIVPLALLAADQQAAGRQRPAHNVLCLRAGQWVDVLLVGSGRPLAWRMTSHDAESVSAEVAQITAGLDEAVTLAVTADIGEAVREAAERAETVSKVVVLEGTRDEMAVSAAKRLLAGRAAPLIDLCRDALAGSDPDRRIRGRVRLAMATAALLLLSVSAALLVRSTRLERVANRLVDEQRAIYQELFPGKRLPVGIAARLESEYAQLAGVTGQEGVVPSLHSSMLLLHDALGPLPTDLRYRLLEIRLEDERVHLDGEARQHSDAEVLAKAVAGGGFDVQPPHTENLPGRGVAFVLSAARRTDAPAE